MHPSRLGLLAISVSILLAACTETRPPATSAPKADKPAPTVAEKPATAITKSEPPAAEKPPAAKPGADQAWSALIDRARQEGTVEVVLAGQLPERLRPLMKEFEQAYGIKVNAQIGAGREHAERLLAEQRAGKYTVDVWMGGANTALAQLYPAQALAPLKPLLVHPEVTDESRWYLGQHLWSDPERQYIITWGANPTGNELSYNTKLFNPSEVQSYWDLIDPKWQGKIVARDPRHTGTSAGVLYFYLSPALGPEWLKRFLTEVKPTIVADARQGAEWLGLGKYSIAMFALANPVKDMKNEGFSVEPYLPHKVKEPPALGAGAANIFIPKQGPHPNAQKLFVNWALMRDAQKKFIDASGDTDSLRIDISNEGVAPEHRIDKSIEYFIPFTDPTYEQKNNEMLKFVNEVMAAAGY